MRAHFLRLGRKKTTILTLVSVALAALVSPWWLLLTTFVGLNML